MMVYLMMMSDVVFFAINIYIYIYWGISVGNPILNQPVQGTTGF